VQVPPVFLSCQDENDPPHDSFKSFKLIIYFVMLEAKMFKCKVIETFRLFSVFCPQHWTLKITFVTLSFASGKSVYCFRFKIVQLLTYGPPLIRQRILKFPLFSIQRQSPIMIIQVDCLQPGYPLKHAKKNGSEASAKHTEVLANPFQPRQPNVEWELYRSAVNSFSMCAIRWWLKEAPSHVLRELSNRKSNQKVKSLAEFVCFV